MPKNSTGATYWICATLPGTFNQAGFEALSWTKVGRVGAVNGDLGRTYQTSSFVDLETGATYTDKGSYDPGGFQVPVAIEEADTGQALVKAAVASRNNYAHKILQRDGKAKYCIGLVTGFPTTVNDANTTTGGVASIKINPDANGNDFVEV
jgi:hypothetical protein